MDLRYNLTIGDHTDFKNDIFTKIVFVKKGTFKICCTGKTDTVKEGEILIIPPFSAVTIPNDSKNEFSITTFSYHIIDNDISFSEKDYFLRIPSDDELSVKLIQFFSARESKPVIDHFFKKSLEYSIIYHAEKHLDNNNSGSINQRLVPFISYIEKNYSQNFTIADLAKSANISESAVYKLFTRYLNASPKQYIRKCRIRHATALLLNTNKSISDIAIETGFYDQFYFSKEFKKEFGVSPSTYRKND